MGELAAAMTTRAQALAAARAGNYAADNRLYAVRITRPAVEPVFDRNLGKLVQAEPQLVYDGPARIATLAPSGQTEIGDAPAYWVSARVSIGNDTALDPRVQDVITIDEDDAGVAAAGNVVGQQLAVVGAARGGYLNLGWSLSATGVERSRDTR